MPANRSRAGAFGLPCSRGGPWEPLPSRGRRNAMHHPSDLVMSHRAAFGLSPALSAAAPVGHVVLLGDSVFDNAGYLAGGGPDIVAQLRARLPSGWRATLLARGSAVARDVPGQLQRLPPNA